MTNNTPPAQIPIPSSDVLTTPVIPSVREGPPQPNHYTPPQVRNAPMIMCDCNSPAKYKVKKSSGEGYYVCAIRDAQWTPECDRRTLGGCGMFRWEDPSKNRYSNKRRRVSPPYSNNNTNYVQQEQPDKVELKNGFYLTKVDVDSLRAELGKKFMETYDVLTDQMINTKLDVEDPDVKVKTVNMLNIHTQILENMLKDLQTIVTQLNILEESK